MKKLIAIAAAAVILVGLIWWSVSRDDTLGDAETNNETELNNASVGDDAETNMTVSAHVGYYDSFRFERKATRELEMTYLDDIISVSATDQETLNDAQEQKLAIVEAMELEFAMESHIMAKGFKDAAVTYRPGSVNVVVNAEVLSDEEVAQILEIVCAEAKVEAKNVKIVTNPE